MKTLFIRESPINELGVFVETDFHAGNRIGYFEGQEVEEDTQHSLYLKSSGRRIEPSGALRYLNHCCTPNARFEERVLSAVRPITEGEEVTIDYAESEPHVSYPFVCRCGAPECRGEILGSTWETQTRQDPSAE